MQPNRIVHILRRYNVVYHTTSVICTLHHHHCVCLCVWRTCPLCVCVCVFWIWATGCKQHLVVNSLVDVHDWIMSGANIKWSWWSGDQCGVDIHCSDGVGVVCWHRCVCGSTQVCVCVAAALVYLWTLRSSVMHVKHCFALVHHSWILITDCQWSCSQFGAASWSVCLMSCWCLSVCVCVCVLDTPVNVQEVIAKVKKAQVCSLNADLVCLSVCDVTDHTDNISYGKCHHWLKPL